MYENVGLPAYAIFIDRSNDALMLAGYFAKLNIGPDLYSALGKTVE